MPAHNHTVSYPAVVHVGDLDHARTTPTYSFEGDGLSVSICPEDWAYIAKLGRHAHALGNPDALFYDASLDDPRDFVHEWCVANDFIDEVDGYRVYYEDGATGDEVYIEVYDRADAEAKHANDADYPNSRIEPVTSLTLAENGRDYWTDAFTKDPADASPIGIRELLPVWYAEGTDDADFDGVWWHNTLDRYNYSAPRGVIFQSKLDDWDELWEGQLDARPPLEELEYLACEGHPDAATTDCTATE